MPAETLYFSSRLKTSLRYRKSAANLFRALEKHEIKCDFIKNTRDIWARDYMPVCTRKGYVSFKYRPGYLRWFPWMRSNFEKKISAQFPGLNITYSDINLDGGNVVFSPSKRKAIVSDRIYEENKTYTEEEQNALLKKLTELLNAQVIIIPAHEKDMTGHADGMVRFISENKVVGNDTGEDFEEDIKTALKKHRIDVTGFPYSDAGVYINYLDTDDYLLLPVFGAEEDIDAVLTAEKIFKKKKEIIPINIKQIAKQGGALNCISWEL